MKFLKKNGKVIPMKEKSGSEEYSKKTKITKKSSGKFGSSDSKYSMKKKSK